MGLPTTSKESSVLIITSEDIWMEADYSGSDYGSEGYESFKTVEIQAKENENDFPNRIKIKYNYSFTYNGGTRYNKALAFEIYKKSELFYRNEITDSSFAKKHISDSLLSEFQSIKEFTEKFQSSELDNVWVVSMKKQSKPLKFLQKCIKEIEAPQSDDVKSFILNTKKDLSDREFRFSVVEALAKIFRPLNLCEDFEYDHKKNPLEIPPSSLWFGHSRWTNNSVECLKKLPVEIADMVMGSYTPFILLTIKRKDAAQLYLTCDDWWPAKVVGKKFSSIYDKPELPTKDDLEKMKEKLLPIIDTFGTLVTVTDVEVIHIKDYKQLFSQKKNPVFMVNCDIRGDQLIKKERFSVTNHRGTAILMIPEESDLISVALTI
ncbi:hypothetical protein GJV85_07195 [Sulfurimonas aquatica]|uniref:Uncharacterized protein n=1 Tax=Sulfurimonas aquatica TaxID=2672570 RepID=A0A975B0K1_9BACT|nr:hypothetical protein [Sulfurimonas aquatica]QSZ41898.1 hypothetical protein GJV85_07195 [Sulfurimonas aquatica]